ncbi:hypothetical protein AGMMS49975_22260 [Clostridia bacterium]|nr:hypothetical protein AGMMS49975_22260 [Clostridia bacterium]
MAEHIRGTHLFEQIVELSNKYIPANSQPRKSILLFDLMVGWFRDARLTGDKNVKFDVKLLHRVLSDTEGIQLNVDIDAVSIKKRLDTRVYSQFFATGAVASRLQICAADLHNKTKPMSSFLFTGSTGTGKALPDDCLIPVYDETGGSGFKRNGDLKPGDFVFNREGNPVKITGVYPQGELDVYQIEFSDGRTLPCCGEHLWTYRSETTAPWKTGRTSEIANEIENTGTKLVIPLGGAVRYPPINYGVSPYVVGAFIGGGCMTLNKLTLTSRDTFVADKFAGLIGASGVKRNPHNPSSHFTLPYFEKKHGRKLYFAAEDIFGDMPEFLGKYSWEKRIPEIYKRGSIEQRTELIQGLFDTNGHISGKKYPILSYYTSSEGLAEDIREILFSLGVRNRVGVRRRKDSRRMTDYVLRVKRSDADKLEFFTVPKKRAALREFNRNLIKRPDLLGIESVKSLGIKLPMTCITVDDSEHLYQAGQYIVTHNTELTKQLAAIMFDDPKRLIRFDMTEFALEDSLERFRSELTARVWERPYSVLLFDEIEKVGYAQQDILKYLLYDKLDISADSGGARIVATRFEEEVVTAVAGFINRAGGQFGRLVVKVEGDMAIDNKTQLESSAHISIYPVDNNLGV